MAVFVQKDVLNDKQLKAIEFILQGMSLTDIAKHIGVSRQAISKWRNNNEVFKAELDKQRRSLESHVNSRLLMNVEPLMDRLIDIALNSKNENTSLTAITYALNRLCGTPTAKIESTVEDVTGNEAVDIKAMLNKLNKDNITLPKGKDK